MWNSTKFGKTTHHLAELPTIWPAEVARTASVELEKHARY